MARETRMVPADFGARLRAARAYADDISREEFAARLNLPGASASNLRKWESGMSSPGPLTAEGLIPRLADATGMPEEFFWGEVPTPADEGKIDKLLTEVQALRSDVGGLVEARQAARDRLRRLTPEDAEDAYELLTELRSLAGRIGRDSSKRGPQVGRAKDRLERRAEDGG